ncbi:MAG: hypothetical protein JW747_10755 [Candidatus Aminicenantes bacterium]|nr:hypothetical protein [Candidatus Aminicenantes bacterium]
MALDDLNSAKTESLGESYKSARAYIEAALVCERDTLDSILELATDKTKVGAHIAAMKRTVDAVAAAQLAVLKVHMETTASNLGTKPVAVVLTDLEKTAAKMIPKPTAKVRANDYRGYSQFIEQIPKEERDKNPLISFSQFFIHRSTSSLTRTRDFSVSRASAWSLR